MNYDIVIWGATSFVGQYVAERLLNTYGKSGTLRIAFAGRSEQKLNELKQKLCATDIPLLVGDAKDQAFLSKMVENTKVVISTVGPYALYGEEVVKACCEQGKDYCDLTGEPQWIAQMIQKYENLANHTGARIINCCGFDSIPSDVGNFLLQSKAKEQLGEYLTQVRYQFRASKGGISGGTAASMINAIKSIRENPQSAKHFKTPYALIKNKPTDLPFQPSVRGVSKDSESGCYLAPFVMASINTKVVHRSNYLHDYKWGKSFLYDEAMSMGKGIKGWYRATWLTLGLGAFAFAASFGWSRKLLQLLLLPKPGEGPDEQLVRAGYFNVRLHGTDAHGNGLTMRVIGQGDPGYGSTSKMITEVANLLVETHDSKSKVGFLTPSFAFEHDLVERLQQRADIEFKFEQSGS